MQQVCHTGINQGCCDNPVSGSAERTVASPPNKAAYNVLLRPKRTKSQQCQAPHMHTRTSFPCLALPSMRAHLYRYLSSTGSTGAPATNAPVEKVSRQCAGLVVPSGATMNSGYLPHGAQHGIGLALGKAWRKAGAQQPGTCKLPCARRHAHALQAHTRAEPCLNRGGLLAVAMTSQTCTLALSCPDQRNAAARSTRGVGCLLL